MAAPTSRPPALSLAYQHHHLDAEPTFAGVLRLDESGQIVGSYEPTRAGEHARYAIEEIGVVVDGRWLRARDGAEFFDALATRGPILADVIVDPLDGAPF